MVKMIYRRVQITDCSVGNIRFTELFQIFSATLMPEMDFRQFRAYYLSSRLKYIDVTFIINENRIIGFCAAAFYQSTVGDKRYVIGRAATGILPEYRGRHLPKWKLYKKYIQYWIKNPFRNFILSAYVANPLIYAMICKYTAIAYPRLGTMPPQDIVRLKDALVRMQKLRLTDIKSFVVEIHFCVAIDQKDQQRIFTSSDGAVKYFLQINPAFMRQHGVVVIIPVNLTNILGTICRFCYYTLVRLFEKITFILSLQGKKHRK